MAVYTCNLRRNLKFMTSPSYIVRPSQNKVKQTTKKRNYYTLYQVQAITAPR